MSAGLACAACGVSGIVGQEQAAHHALRKDGTRGCTTTHEPGTFALNYPGDVTADMKPGQRTTPFGVPLMSNIWGQLTRSGAGYPLEIRDSTYDGVVDRTRVVLVPAAGGSA